MNNPISPSFVITTSMILLHQVCFERISQIFIKYSRLKKKFEFEAWWSNMTLLKSSNTPTNIMKLILLSYISENTLFFQYLIINSLKNTKTNALENYKSKPDVIMKLVYGKEKYGLKVK